MQLYNWDEITEEQLSPLVTRKVIHGETITIARLRLRKGCTVPTHSHVNEQLSTIESGVMRLVVGDQEVVVRAGETLRIPPNVPHSAETLEDCVAVDIFSPVREDWLRGEDAYLRG